MWILFSWVGTCSMRQSPLQPVCIDVWHCFVNTAWETGKCHRNKLFYITYNFVNLILSQPDFLSGPSLLTFWVTMIWFSRNPLNQSLIMRTRTLMCQFPFSQFMAIMTIQLVCVCMLLPLFWVGHEEVKAKCTKFQVRMPSVALISLAVLD